MKWLVFVFDRNIYSQINSLFLKCSGNTRSSGAMASNQCFPSLTVRAPGVDTAYKPPLRHGGVAVSRPS